MELSSEINRRWKLCIIGSILWSVVLLLYLNHNATSLSFLAVTNTIQQSPLYNESEAPPSSSIWAKPLVQSLFSLETSEAPISSMRANPPVQQSIFDAQSDKPVEEILFADQSEPPISSLQVNPPVQEAPTQDHLTVNELKKSANNPSSEIKCNVFQGKWVYQPEESPVYDSFKCPFIERKMSCQKNGRPDNDYEKWRWVANDCHIPLFNGREMLERLRNKRMVIVGDSLNRNMWESLACLLYSSIPSLRAQVQAKQLFYKVLKAKDYNTVIEFHWSPFLVEYDIGNKSGKKVLVLDKISPNSKLWRGADVMVFNTAYWWTHRRDLKKWDLLQYKGRFLPERFKLEKAYEIGLTTWAKWILKNVDLKKTIVFFRSVSPQHNGNPHCYNVNKPINNESFYINKFPKSVIDVAERVIKGMNKSEIIYLNITKLSEYRMDAHPSVFKSPQGNIISTKYKNLIRTSSDCSHWCLPGLPDTWNRFIYAKLVCNITWNTLSN